MCDLNKNLTFNIFNHKNITYLIQESVSLKMFDLYKTEFIYSSIISRRGREDFRSLARDGDSLKTESC